MDSNTAPSASDTIRGSLFPYRQCGSSPDQKDQSFCRPNPQPRVYGREPLDSSSELPRSSSPRHLKPIMPASHHPTLSGFEYINFEDTNVTGSEIRGNDPKPSEGVLTRRDFINPSATAAPQTSSSTLTYPASACTAPSVVPSHPTNSSPSLSVDEKISDSSDHHHHHHHHHATNTNARVKNRVSILNHDRRPYYQRMESNQPYTPEMTPKARPHRQQSIRFAEGDFPTPTNAFTKSWISLVYDHIIIRWFVFITPILLVVWIPGIIGLTLSKDHLKVWGVELVWWSAWLSIAWTGWWIGLMVGMLLPTAFRVTIGVVLSPGFVEKWVGYLIPMKKAIMGSIWALLSWLTFNLFVLKHKVDDIHDGDARLLHLIVQALFGMFLSSLILVAEKLLIQIIASNFHRRSYEDRIREQKGFIRALVTLYVNSHDIGRSDTLDRGYLNNQHRSADPAKLFRTALKGVRQAAKSTTTVFGTVASEIAGERILQPNSPGSMVLSALSSVNKTRQLARRLYYSFVPTHYRQVMVASDIGKFFEHDLQAREAFAFFDKDENGDASLEEIEMACLELHRDRISLSSSMRDLDSAVGRLDSILMFIWYFISMLIIVALLDVSFQTMIASAGTLTLGLSWLIGTTAQEILSSIVFLFIKHPYDVGDRVDVDDVTYIVKEMHLLYTVFQQTDGRINQLPHSLLNAKRIVNIRRSGAISEPFKWDVDFNTPFEKIEALREKMLTFLQSQKRDFMPSIDISVEDFEGQAKMTLKANILYKSNWQNSGLKTQRRNKWLCALKQVMEELEMWGPGGAGNPNPPPDPTLIQLIDTSSSPPAPATKNPASPLQDPRTPVRSVQFGDSQQLPSDLGWLDEPIDTSPPLLPASTSLHVPMDRNPSRSPSPSKTDIEMQYQH